LVRESSSRYSSNKCRLRNNSSNKCRGRDSRVIMGIGEQVRESSIIKSSILRAITRVSSSSSRVIREISREALSKMGSIGGSNEHEEV
jgi:hypothetical protein